MSGILDPKDFCLSPEDIAAMKKSVAKSSPADKPKHGIEFYPFPGDVVDALIRANYAPAWTLAAVVYKTWYRDYKKLNPVLVTSAILAKYGLTRHQKSRALKILENSGQYSVERSANRNPLVMIKWKLVKELMSSNTK
jgi:hypothetical protein